MSEPQATKQTTTTAHDNFVTIENIIAIQEAEIANEKDRLEAKEHNLNTLKAQFEEMSRLCLPPMVTAKYEVGGFSFKFDRPFLDRSHDYKKDNPESYHFSNIQDDLANALLGCEHVYEVNAYCIGDGTLQTKNNYNQDALGMTREEFDDMVFAELAQIIRTVLTRHGYLPATFGEIFDTRIATHTK